jgi:hypothetical protein
MSNLRYTRHAARRCQERGITAMQVREAVKSGKLVSFAGHKEIYARGRLLVILMDEVIITAYRKRKPKGCLRRAWRGRKFARV